jgi:two-component system response regulator YesN
VAGVGGAHGAATGARLSFDEALRTAERRITLGEGLFLPEAARPASASDLDVLDAYPERMCAALRMRDEPGFHLLLDEWLRGLALPQVSALRARQSALRLLLALADLRGPASDESEVPVFGEDAYVRSVELACGLGELRRIVNQTALSVSAALRGGATGAGEKKIVEFKAYLTKNYARHDLSITQVGKDLSVSPSYLSKILKRHLERSFVDCITEYRLEKAKELLVGSDLKTYEIAEATGYPDARYFSTVFKRLTGLAPTEYRTQRTRRA